MDDALKKILDEIYEDIWDKIDTGYIGTFAEFKKEDNDDI